MSSSIQRIVYYNQMSDLTLTPGQNEEVSDCKKKKYLSIWYTSCTHKGHVNLDFLKYIMQPLCYIIYSRHQKLMHLTLH